MIDELIKNIMKQVKAEYPQVEVPGAMRAEILSAEKSDMTYKRTVFLTDKQGGEKREYELEEECYKYSVKILDNDGNGLEKYPVIPNVMSRMEFEAGSHVTVVFTGGELAVSIVGERYDA